MDAMTVNLAAGPECGALWKVYASPVVAPDGSVLFTSTDGYVYAVGGALQPIQRCCCEPNDANCVPNLRM